MTEQERGILFKIQQLQAKWADTVEMCLSHMLKQRESIEALRQEIGEMKEQIAALRQGGLFERGDSL
jgi:hypothetical protein